MTAYFGKFSGNPRTEWLTDSAAEDRDMKLLEAFWYEDPAARRWDAPAGSVVNGASIPRSLWALIGSPYTGDYRKASIVHDVACDDPAVAREDADRMFHFACRAGGCTHTEAARLYLGVRIGAWWSGREGCKVVSRGDLRHRFDTLDEKQAEILIGKFSEILPEILKGGEAPGFDELKTLVDARLISGSKKSAPKKKPGKK